MFLVSETVLAAGDNSVKLMQKPSVLFWVWPISQKQDAENN